MKKADHILVPIDYTEDAHNAIMYASHFAERFQATIHILNVVDRKSLSLGDVLESTFVDDADRAERSRILTALKAARTDAMTDDTVKVVAAERNGLSVVGSILEYARTHDIDMIVMSMHERNSVLARVMNRNVTEEIVSLSPCPVLTVPEGITSKAEAVEHSRTFISVNGDEACPVKQKSKSFRLLERSHR